MSSAEYEEAEVVSSLEDTAVEESSLEEITEEESSAEEESSDEDDEASQPVRQMTERSAIDLIDFDFIFNSPEITKANP